MKISLIGMSGSGKTYWSKKLSQNGFESFCCDYLIEKKLDKELTSLGYSGIEDVAKWMGQPFAPQYEQTSERYLELEKEVLEEILNFVEKTHNQDNIVIDTTGSVIYLNKTILERLSKSTKIIFLDTPASVKQEMYELYLKEPKPVIWGNSFQKKKNESDIQALRRCYPELLAFRTKQYKKLAHITLNYHKLHRPDYSLDQFLNQITDITFNINKNDYL